MDLQELRERLKLLQEESETLIAKADTEKRQLTDEESVKLDELGAEFDKTHKEIEQRQKIEAQKDALEAPEPRRAPLLLQTGPGDPEVRREPARVADRNDGFKDFGEFAIAVAHACHRGNPVIDPRLERRAPTTWSSEATGTDGGFAVPADMRSDIQARLDSEDSLMARCDTVTTESNQVTFPNDMNAPWSTTGIRPYWTGEGSQLTESKVELEEITVKLNKQTVLVPVTEELLSDASAMSSYVARKAAEKMMDDMNVKIMSGNGVGQPLGIINGPGYIQAARTTASTIKKAAVQAMWIRFYGPSRAGGVWVVNQDCESQLMDMYGIDTESTPLTTWPVYLPQGGFSASPFATLMGRPIVYTQAAETLGDTGDINLVNFREYLIVRKTEGIRADTSIHLYFDYDMTCFRFIFRVGGLPWWSSTVAARDGSATYSPYVGLDAGS